MSITGILMLASALGATPAEDAPDAEQLSQAVRRAIPYIEEKGVWWMEEKKCVTCHRIGSMVWSLGAARSRGFEVSEKLDAWFDWSIEKSLADNKGKPTGAGNREGVAQLLLARDLFGQANERRDSYDQLIKIVSEEQQPDGTWNPGGQLPFQKRKKEETVEVTTAWLALALAGYERGEDRQAAIDKAVKHLKSTTQGKSTEWYAVRLLIAWKTGDEITADAMVEALRGQQQADGGWGWLIGEGSDALGTGIVLYALFSSDVDRQDAAIARAQRFLIDTQQDDGSWPVKGTKEKKKETAQETAVYWGTTWAVLAIVKSLPE